GFRGEVEAEQAPAHRKARDAGEQYDAALAVVKRSFTAVAVVAGSWTRAAQSRTDARGARRCCSPRRSRSRGAGCPSSCAIFQKKGRWSKPIASRSKDPPPSSSAMSFG